MGIIYFYDNVAFVVKTEYPGQQRVADKELNHAFLSAEIIVFEGLASVLILISRNGNGHPGVVAVTC